MLKINITNVSSKEILLLIDENKGKFGIYGRNFIDDDFMIFFESEEERTSFILNHEEETKDYIFEDGDEDFVKIIDEDYINLLKQYAILDEEFEKKWQIERGI